jgi:uncharacterized protein DUF4384
MLAQLALLALATVPTAETRHPSHALYRPRIEIWTNRGDAAVYTRGERVRVYLRSDRDAFVTVFRVDTDGRVRVLFPRDPWEDSFVRGGREFELEGRSANDAFAIDDYAGVGYLFAVASADAFTYDAIENGDHWDYRVIADGRVRGDPYVALTDLAQRIVPEGYTDWDYDIVSYNVGQHYDYPRFLCYDCHSYVSYPYWDPYAYSCVRFRIVMFDDPYYYPYRYYGGTRVVFVRPYRPQPRFIFKDWGTNQPTRDRFVSRERERPVNDNTRRGVTGRDIGGIGSIPPPNARDRRERPANPGQPGDQGNDDGDHGRGRGRRERPDHPDRPEHPDRPDRPDRPDHPDNPSRRDRSGSDGEGKADRSGRPDRPQVEPRREVREPRRDAPEPRREVREPRRDAAEPRREARESRRAEPRSEPKAQPRRESAPPKEKARSEPEVRRRKP